MATADHHPSRANGTADDVATLDVRWPAVLNRWNDALGLCNGATHLRIELVVQVNVAGPQAGVEAFVRWPSGRLDILQPQSFDCTLTRTPAMTHLDVRAADRRLIALSIDSGPRLLYAQTSLFEPAGLSSAAFDPPQLVRCQLQCARRRASVATSP